MVLSISGSVQRFSRLSFRVMRSVPRKPETLALTRVDCRDALTTYTSRAGMPLARAMLRIGSLTRASSSFGYLLKIGRMKPGAITALGGRKAPITTQRQLHQLGRARRPPAQ